MLHSSETKTMASHELGGTGSAATSVNPIRICNSRDGLAAINERATELVVWQRTLPICLREWINRAAPSTLPAIRILVKPDDLQIALNPLLDESGLAAGDMRNLLVKDIDDLVAVFSDITHSDLVDVRLESIAHDACWKFHRDAVEARLITTYRGPATEWVQLEHAEHALYEQKEFEGPLERLGDTDVAIFKGSSAGLDSGIVHRSPPIEGTGCTRLLLCLNKRTIVSPDPWKPA